jgi:hypothetical protein
MKLPPMMSDDSLGTIEWTFAQHPLYPWLLNWGGIPEPKGDHDWPSHRAMRLAGTPPMLENLPPATIDTAVPWPNAANAWTPPSGGTAAPGSQWGWQI